MNLLRFVPLLGAFSLLAMAANANNRSVLTVTTPADSAPGSLRNMIAMAAPGDVITFAAPMTINLTSPIVVGVDNITIEACYPDVTINAAGLFPGLEFPGRTGCAVRGLRMEGFDPALVFYGGSFANKVGGSSPCDRVEIHNGGYGIVLSDAGTIQNELSNVEVRHNMFEGIYLRAGASFNRFGDGTFPGAVFSHSNGLNGVLLETIPGVTGTVEGNEFLHCLIGTDLSGTAAAGNSLSGVVLSGSSVSDNRFLSCVLSGNGTVGVAITGGASLNMFNKCHIGMDVAGTGAIGNTIGVDIAAGSLNSFDTDNVISGNQLHGVRISSSSSFQNAIARNKIGPDITGAAVGNGHDGVLLMDGTWENALKENHISSNGHNGVALLGNDPHDNSIENNKIGTDQAGSAAMSNGRHGVLIASVASKNYLTGNLVSGNVGYGVAITSLGCDQNELRANTIGLDGARVNAVPNMLGGVLVEGSQNIIGGLSPNDGNYICANTGWGVEVRGPALGFFASKNELLGNTIGTSGLGNSSGGVWLDSGAVDNFVGGLVPSTGGAPANYIWENGGHGVLVQNASSPDPADGNQILSNSITGNSGEGIELAGAGNCMIPAPLITAANSVSVQGYSTVASTPCLVQVFRDTDDEGLELLGEVWVGSSYGFFSVPATLSPGDRVTATQTAELGCTTVQAETSPFSLAMTAVEIGIPDCFCPNAVAICGNPDPNAGCANSTGVGGLLKAHGSTSTADDDLTFSATQLPTGSFSMLVGSRAQRNVPFRDGRLCVGGSGLRIWRFQLKNTRQWGAAVYGEGLVARSLSFASAAGHITSGDTWYFQSFYRDTLGPCGSGGNLSNSVEITFTP